MRNAAMEHYLFVIRWFTYKKCYSSIPLSDYLKGIFRPKKFEVKDVRLEDGGRKAAVKVPTNMGVSINGGTQNGWFVSWKINL